MQRLKSFLEGKNLIILASILVAITIIATILILALSGGEKPLTAQEMLNLGDKYLLELNYEQALVQFLRVIEIEPMNPRAYIGAAEAYLALNQPEKAIEILELGYERTNDSEIKRMLDELTAESNPNPQDTTTTTTSTTTTTTSTTPDTLTTPDENTTPTTTTTTTTQPTANTPSTTTTTTTTRNIPTTTTTTRTTTTTAPPNSEVVNARGNTEGNTTNNGLAAIQGNWIYYSNNGLFKIRTDGTERTRLNTDNAAYINVIGDWIYYTIAKTGDIRVVEKNDIYRMRIDGTGRQLLVNGGITSNIDVVGDWIYFGLLRTERLYDDFLGWMDIQFSDLYRIRTNGTGLIKLTESTFIWDINVVGNWVYYTNTFHGGEWLNKIRIDGTGEIRFNNVNVTRINVEGDWIFFSERGILLRMRTDGRGVENLNIVCSAFNVVGDWVYYSGDFSNQGIFRARTNGAGVTKINNDDACSINIVGDWIYYINMGDNSRLYRIRTDGTGRERIN
jgi:hypothetical protein